MKPSRSVLAVTTVGAMSISTTPWVGSMGLMAAWATETVATEAIAAAAILVMMDMVSFLSVRAVPLRGAGEPAVPVGPGIGVVLSGAAVPLR